MCKLTISQLHLFDFLLKRAVRCSRQHAYYQPVIRLDGHFLKCDFFIYSNSLMPVDNDFFASKPAEDIFDAFCINADCRCVKYSAEMADCLSNLLKNPKSLFEKTLAFVKTQSIESKSNYIYNVSFLDSNANLPFLYLDSDLEYEIVSICQI